MHIPKLNVTEFTDLQPELIGKIVTIKYKDPTHVVAVGALASYSHENGRTIINFTHGQRFYAERGVVLMITLHTDNIGR